MEALSGTCCEVHQVIWLDLPLQNVHKPEQMPQKRPSPRKEHGLNVTVGREMSLTEGKVGGHGSQNAVIHLNPMFSVGKHTFRFDWSPPIKKTSVLTSLKNRLLVFCQDAGGTVFQLYAMGEGI